MKQFKVGNYYHIKSRLWLNDDKVFNELSELTVKCKCGKSITFVYDQKYKICSECGRKVYNNTKAYFKYKLRGELHGKKDKLSIDYTR